MVVMSKRKLVAIILLLLFAIFLISSFIGFLIVSTRFYGTPQIFVTSDLRQVRLDDDLHSLHVSFSSATGNFPSNISEITIYASLHRIAKISNPLFIKGDTWTLQTNEGNITQDLFTTVVPIEDSSLVYLGLDKNGLPINQTLVEMHLLCFNEHLMSQNDLLFLNRTAILRP
jgi:hypothetical protein